MSLGNKNRSVGSTAMNATSSRSHSIFQVKIETAEPALEVDGKKPEDKDKERVRAGILNLVDLAGSERQSKTKAEGQRLKEATKVRFFCYSYKFFLHFNLLSFFLLLPRLTCPCLLSVTSFRPWRLASFSTFRIVIPN
jgi:hypothetical protein